MNKNQRGFSAVEALLLLIIAGLLGFIGWYVWNANTKSNETMNASSGSVNPQATKQKSGTKPSTSLGLQVQDLNNSCASDVGLKVCGDIKHEKVVVLDEIWVEYGIDKSNLDKSTIHFPYYPPKETENAKYVLSDFNINYSELSYSTVYYFKIKAKTSGKVIESVLGTFTTVPKG